MVTAANVSRTIKRKISCLTVQGDVMPKLSEAEAAEKRWKIQRCFWDVVGLVEHISVPKLQDAIRKEFRICDNRFVEAQVRLMQTEGRIRVEEKVKVWIKQPQECLKG
jgi:hypothetical protein